MAIEPQLIHMMRLVLVVAALGLCLVTDLQERRIPNAVTYPCFALGLLLWVADAGAAGILQGALGAVVGGALFVLPVTMLKLGMGDLKLAMALGAVGGPSFALWLGLYAMVAGGIVTVIDLKRRGNLQTVTRAMTQDIASGAAPRARSGLAIPYAVPIAIGAAIALVTPGLPQ